MRPRELPTSHQTFVVKHQTIGGGSNAPEAVSRIMGDVDNSMAGACRDYSNDDRIVAVTETVRSWLFSD